VTIGGGATRQVTDEISSLGSNLMMVTPGKRMGPGQGSGGAPFKLADAEAIAREIPSIRAVAPTSASPVTAIYANENWSTTVTGTTDQYFEVSNLKIEDGRSFTPPEIRSGAAVCIIGETVRENLFGRQNPIGGNIRLNKLSCEVIGLLESKGQSSMGSDQDDTVIIPLRTFQRRISGNTDVHLIRLSVKDGVSTDKMKKEIGYLMRERRHLSDMEEDDFSVMDMKEIATMLTGTTKVLTGLLGAVAAVSLLVEGTALGHGEHVSMAQGALGFLWSQLYRPGDGMAHYHDGKARRWGLLDDDAEAAIAFLYAFAYTGERPYLDRAETLLHLLLDLHWDEKRSLFMDTAPGKSLPGLRPEPAEPGSQSRAAEAMLLYRSFGGEEKWRDLAGKALSSVARIADAYGYMAASFASAVNLHLRGPLLVKIVGGTVDTARPFLRVAALSPQARTLPAISEKMGRIDGEIWSEVCTWQDCRLHTADPETLARNLGVTAELSEEVDQGEGGIPG